jgi:hypothetical protein
MAVCPDCGEDNPEKARFCMVCATPLDLLLQPQAEERKVVSILFVDLVGFTARSHDLDPEDVRAALQLPGPRCGSRSRSATEPHMSP